MKNSIIILSIFLACLTGSCVQKSYEQIVTVFLDVSGIPNIKTVGVRGEGKPLSWDSDLPMKEIVKDSLYSVTVTAQTGYLFAEIKFLVNGEFELKEKDNRRVFFDVSRKTVYKAKFNVLNQ
jgi:PBP1b-binding outer membrane lipoprotein LpoB